MSIGIVKKAFPFTISTILGMAITFWTNRYGRISLAFKI
jgi:hypothetical protein